MAEETQEGTRSSLVAQPARAARGHALQPQALHPESFWLPLTMGREKVPGKGYCSYLLSHHPPSCAGFLLYKP